MSVEPKIQPKNSKSHPLLRPLWVFFGICALILGIIGAFLPLLPTTPLIILAAFCFSKGSRRLHGWILARKGFGPMIRDWETDGIIPLKAKLLATFMIITMVGYALWFKVEVFGLRIAIVLTIFCTLTYIWTRPSVANLNDRSKNDV